MRKIVAVNEGIRGVVKASAALNLTAINAMLIAKQGGERVRGFSVVSSELRVFSQMLERSMAELNSLIAKMVKDIAFMQKERHAMRFLKLAAKKTETAATQLALTISRKQSLLRELDQAMIRDWDDLCAKLRQASRFCQAAAVLARSARIEAVYGGKMAFTLKQVAQDIDLTAASIIEKMNRLNALVAEGGLQVNQAENSR